MHIYGKTTLERRVSVCPCVCVRVYSIYSLLIVHNVHSSHLETLIKCYYQHKHFHLLSFYYETFASVCIYVYV